MKDSWCNLDIIIRGPLGAGVDLNGCAQESCVSISIALPVKLDSGEYLPQNPFDDKLISVQVMAWCRQATSHYLRQAITRASINPALFRHMTSL